MQLSTPEREMEDAERRQLVHRALERLSRKDCEALSLYYLEGLSYARIATALGVSEGVVKGRLQRARNRLRKELKMVEEGFLKAQLPEDFVARIQALLDRVTDDRAQHQAVIETLGGRAAEPGARRRAQMGAARGGLGAVRYLVIPGRYSRCCVCCGPANGMLSKRTAFPT